MGCTVKLSRTWITSLSTHLRESISTTGVSVPRTVHCFHQAQFHRFLDHSKTSFTTYNGVKDWPGLGDPQLSSTNSEPWMTKSLIQTMKELGHYDEKNPITILKIDIEGAEWDALIAFFGDPTTSSMLKNGFIKQLLVEWHWDPDSR
jgi:hypothetical protein